MKIITTKTKAYSFDELSERAKETVIQDETDFLSETYDGQWIIEDETNRLINIGYIDPEISYSGFNSQGDGASFTCSRIDLWQWIKFNKLCKVYRSLKKYIDSGDITGSIDRVTSHYVHERTVTANVESSFDNVPERLNSLINQLEQTLDQDCETQGAAIYKTLESEWDDMLSEETIAQNIKDNERLFTVTGELLPHSLQEEAK